LLDTNTCIRYLNGRAVGVRRRLQSLSPDEVAVSSVVKAELFAGAVRSTDPVRSRARQEAFLAPYASLPFDDPAADVYGRIRSHLQAAGTPIGPYDLQIAAIALANKLVLVTHNIREFSRVPNLHLEDWET
jgi:tRNA(fMet)-specific endonuclease VapC